MRVMVVIKATASSEAGEGLKPSSEGVRVHFSGANRDVTDGPFAETKELIAGFWLWDVQSLDEAVEWVKRCPNPMKEDTEIEIRPAYEMQDFAENDPTGEIAAREDDLRQSSASSIENSEDERAILDLMAKWRSALENKDVESMMEDYQDDAVLFDACPPYKAVGVQAIKKTWEACLPYFPDEFKSEHRDLQVQVDGDVAFVYGIHHFVPTPSDHPCGQTWMRISIGLKRIEGDWRVAHEHCSLPFNPMNNQAWYITDPSKLEMPDYSAGSSEGGLQQ